MNREIKFRVWDQIAKNMFSEISLKDSRICGFYDQGYICMQYTGLKDKNGKEIYEGDIVSRELLDKRTGKYFLAKAFGPHKMVVKWDTSINGWNFRIRNRVSKYPINVIGNIYENPELLK